MHFWKRLGGNGFGVGEDGTILVGFLPPLRLRKSRLGKGSLGCRLIAFSVCIVGPRERGLHFDSVLYIILDWYVFTNARTILTMNRLL